MIKNHFIKTSTVLVFVLSIAACGNGRNVAQNQNSAGTISDTRAGNSVATSKALANISNTKNDTTGSGKAEFTSKSDGSVDLMLRVTFPKMANKSVAVHLHEHGDCSDSGKGAHGHWNPTKENHGKWGSSAYHSGDIGNVELDAKGKGQIKFNSKRWTIGGDEKTNILNRAVIVHSGVDDYMTQPTGNAGSRIGCGIITTN